MIRRVKAIVVGLAAAGAVVVVLLRLAARETVLPSVYLVTGLVVLVASGVVAVGRLVGRRTDLVRGSLACLAGIITFLASSPQGCDDVGGVPDWERCVSFLGNPTLEWGGRWVFLVLIPLVVSHRDGSPRVVAGGAPTR